MLMQVSRGLVQIRCALNLDIRVKRQLLDSNAGPALSVLLAYTLGTHVKG